MKHCINPACDAELEESRILGYRWSIAYQQSDDFIGNAHFPNRNIQPNHLMGYPANQERRHILLECIEVDQ